MFRHAASRTLSPRHPLALLFAIAATATLFPSVRAEDPAPVGSDVTVEPGQIVCRVVAAHSTFRVGGEPRVHVEIRNLSPHTIFLPGSLDDSDTRGRYPHAELDLVGPPGGVEQTPLLGCGFRNPLRHENFVELEPGAAFDPYADGFFSDSDFRYSRFARFGTFQVRFRYSTDEPRVAGWRGNTDALPEDLIRLLRRVPRVAIECATELIVEGR